MLTSSQVVFKLNCFPPGVPKSHLAHFSSYHNSYWVSQKFRTLFETYLQIYNVWWVPPASRLAFLEASTSHTLHYLSYLYYVIWYCMMFYNVLRWKQINWFDWLDLIEIETFLERKKSRNYFDAKFTVTTFCIGNLHVKEIMSTKSHYHTKW